MRNRTNKMENGSEVHGDSGSFADATYLGRVIDHLVRARKAQGLTLQEVSRRAHVRRWVILQAEHKRAIPRCPEFKAWAWALGIHWDQIWRECLPENPTSRCAHRDFGKIRLP